MDENLRQEIVYLQNRRMADHEIDMLRRDVQELRESIQEVTSDVKDLVEAWRASLWLVKAVKWSAPVIIAMYGTFEFFKSHFKPL